ncbi:MAG: helix-turn-helix transcriptional regulator [Bacilli bacterium]
MYIPYYEKIRNLREDLDIKQNEFAKMLLLKPVTYNSYELGIRSMSLKTLDLIAMKLDISLDYLFSLSKEKSYQQSSAINYDTLIKNLITIRNLNHLSQREIAIKMVCTQQVWSKYEKGKLLLPIDYLINFC